MRYVFRFKYPLQVWQDKSCNLGQNKWYISTTPPHFNDAKMSPLCFMLLRAFIIALWGEGGDIVGNSVPRGDTPGTIKWGCAARFPKPLSYLIYDLTKNLTSY